MRFERRTEEAWARKVPTYSHSWSYLQSPCHGSPMGRFPLLLHNGWHATRHCCSVFSTPTILTKRKEVFNAAHLRKQPGFFGPPDIHSTYKPLPTNSIITSTPTYDRWVRRRPGDSKRNHGLSNETYFIPRQVKVNTSRPPFAHCISSSGNRLRVKYPKPAGLRQQPLPLYPDWLGTSLGSRAVGRPG